MTPMRRRMLGILACGLGGALACDAAGAPVLTWRGTALGAEARVALRHADARRAARALDAVLAEIERLEGEFSLHRADSAISRLNRDGRLPRPSLDMRNLLRRAVHHGEITGGAFDVTVQPLWQAVSDATRTGTEPDPRMLDTVRRLVDFRAIAISPAEIRFTRPGMAVTLNAIAQGYITDRIGALLADSGLPDALVDLGELRAGTAPWRVALAHPGRAAVRATLADRGLATSCGEASRFTPDGRWHHIIDPRSAACPPAMRAASVLAPTAADADALATALVLLPPAAMPDLLRRAGAASMLHSEPGHPQRWLA